ncbi:MAG: tetratricopeptide repeat protein [Bacteroidia bacterium]|nr:tetratricopeptide repeat protein [Bacteroidia bacterium]
MAQNRDIQNKDRLEFALRAQELSKQIDEDSTILKSNRVLSSIYLDTDDYQPFGFINHENLKLSQKLKDSTIWAYSHHNLGYYFYTQLNNDSSYYHYFNAAKLYRALRDIKNEGEVLLNMADIQESEKDYIGSENNAIRAISLIETLPQNENNLETLWSLYNLLGVNTFRLGQYDDALRYHEQALEFSDKMEDNYVYNIFSRNNIALAYRELKNYDKALEEHNRLLDDKKLITNFPEAYASYLNNLAYTKFLSKRFDDDKIQQEFMKAYETCDTLNEPKRMMFICNNIAEYYMSKQQLDTAYFYAKEAYKYGRESQSYEEVLVSLKFMSNIKGGEEGRAYLNEHIKLNDSLLQIERSIRNKFAKIEFETDQIKAENVQISRERLIFLLSSVGLLVTLLLLYIIITQRAKNKELEFSQKQQQANEEIYNLMLAQQDKIDEGRTKEKKRISEELHDGILGRLFGTRLSLDSLNLQQTEEAVKTRGQYIEELKSIEQEIRKISHDLNADFVTGSSFTDIIKTLIDNQTQAYQLTFDYYEDDEIDWDGLSNKTKIHVYRMLQETMQNIYKHANANHIKISFQLKNNVILLMVEDDGDGFNTGKARKGIGIKNFESRASEIGGKVEIFSKIGHGTRVKIHVPL